MNATVFLPELAVMAMALLMFVVSMAKPNAQRDFTLAVVLGAVVVAAGVASLRSEGLLFFGTYRIDIFSQVFKIALGVGLLLAISVCLDFKGVDENLHGEYYTFMATGTLGLMMLVSSMELLTMYVALELSSYSLYVMLPMRRGFAHDAEASIKYVLFGAVSSCIMVFGLSFIYGLTHTTMLSEIMPQIPVLASQPLGLAAILMTICGFFFKLTVFPFHAWAPDVYQGAANETATFIATAPKVGAVALLLRLVTLAGVDGVGLVKVLIILSVASMTFGNLVAIVQKDLKRMLAYSSIAHAGYVIIGVLTLSELGYMSSIYYIFGYLLMNFAVFMVVVKVSQDGGNVSIEQLAGLYKRAPLLALTLMLSLFALAGIPPSVGFVGKWMLFTAALEKGYLWLVIIAAANSTVSLYYYLCVVRAAYCMSPGDLPAVKIDMPTRVMSYVMIAAIVGVGVVPAPLIEMARSAARTLL
ncbi:MAG: NADH-quinone oxidoreductase subunit N [Pseudomonadota bacterium]